MPWLAPKDIVAVVALICLATLKLTGHDGAIDTLVALIIGYYFAHRADGTDRGV